MPNHLTAATTGLLGLTFASFGALAAQDLGVRPVDGVDVETQVPTTHPTTNALDHPHAKDRIFIRFRSSASPEQQQEILAQVGRSLQTFDLVEGLHCIELSVPVAEALELVKYRTDVLRYAEPVYLLESYTTLPSEGIGNLCGMQSIGMPDAWDVTVGNEDIVVAVIDSGMDLSHPDLVDNLYVKPGESSNGLDDDFNGFIDDISGWDFFDNDRFPSDTIGHGTHVCGTIGAVGNNGVGVVGVAWVCKLMPLRVGDVFLDSQAILNAINYACQNGAKISNNSYGGGGASQSAFDVIQAAGQQYQHVFVAAAGNNGSNGASYPAAYSLPNIISVAAVDCNDNLAGFSQFGIPSVDVGAPGMNINSTYTNGGYTSQSGTSMASPHVAGLAALVYREMGNPTPEEVVEKILDNARPVSSLNGLVVSGGIIDAAATLNDLFQGPVGSLVTDLPSSVEPNVATPVQFVVDPREDALTSVELFTRQTTSEPWRPAPIQNTFGNVWEGTIPGSSCSDTPQFYLRYTGAQAGQQTLPANGPFQPFGVLVGTPPEIELDFNTSAGWTATSSADVGGWVRAVPSGDSVSVDDCSAPSQDFDGSGLCWVTGNGVSNSACANDIDNGSTTLTSAVYADAVDADPVTFAWWYDNTSANNDQYDDLFVIEVSGDSGGSWVQYAAVANGNSAQTGWVSETFTIGDFVQVSSGFRIRFTASDADPGSVVEAAIDGFTLGSFTCVDAPACTTSGDLDLDGAIGGIDLALILGNWNCTGPGCTGDANCDGVVNGQDLAQVLADWNP